MVDLVVILQTYKRTDYALRTIGAMQQWLLSQEPISWGWLVVDDGSEQAHLDAVTSQIGDDFLLGIYSRREGYGALANRAWRGSAQQGEVTLWLEDDWILQAEGFNLRHYLDLLRTDTAIGMVRLARIPIGLHGQVIGDGKEVHLRLIKGEGQYYFSGNPSLRHYRFYEAYGDYPEGLPPGDTELGYDGKIQGIAGPDIIIPFDIGTWGCFGHIGAEKSY